MDVNAWDIRGFLSRNGAAEEVKRVARRRVKKRWRRRCRRRISERERESRKVGDRWRGVLVFVGGAEPFASRAFRISKSFKLDAVARNTRSEARIAVSLYLSDPPPASSALRELLTIAPYLSGVGAES